MLHGHIRIRTFGLKRVRIAIERDCDRKLNVSKPSRTEGIHSALSVAKAFASDATLRRANRRSGKKFAPTDCNLDVRHLQFSANLSLQGKTTDALKRSVAGAASPYGGNLRLEIGDLDRKFSRYESSQSFNLVDVGAFFFAGPLALGLTKGYDFARIFEGGGGTTTIRVLVSNWRVERGVAHATDVAMATKENRVALKGGLDFVSGRFDEVTVALIDAKGCVRAKQRIRGPFRRPEIEEPQVLSTLSGPARKLIKQAGELFGGKCHVFYAGSVEPPGLD